MYVKPSADDVIHSASCSANNNFPLINSETSYSNVIFISKEQEYEIMKNRTLNQLNNIYRYNSKLDLTGQSKKINKDNKYEYLVLLSEKKLSVIYSYGVGDNEFDSYKLIYNLADVNDNPYSINVTGLDYVASRFRLSNETCYLENVENDEDKETNCGKNEKIYFYKNFVSSYERLNETIFETPFIINIKYDKGYLVLEPDESSIDKDDLPKINDLKNVNINQRGIYI